MSNNTINIRSVDLEEFEAIKEQNKQSNFFITVNTNQRVGGRQDELVVLFGEVVTNFCNNMPDFIDTYEGHPTDDARTYDIIPRIEKGPKTKCLHLHLRLEITHRSKIKVNFKRVRKYFKEELGLNGLHMNVKNYRKNDNPTYSNSDKILRYISKE